MANVLTELLRTFTLPGSSTKQVIGAVIPSATTIVPVFPVFHVSGTTDVVNITPPGDDFAGFIVIIADGAFAFTTAGNIAKALTATAAQAIMLFYSPVDSKWYPVKI